MANIFIVHDIVEENGKTIRENNMDLEHKIPIGSLVELPDGERLFVCRHSRDCDGTPLYEMTMKGDIGKDWANLNTRIYGNLLSGYSEDSLKLIK